MWLAARQELFSSQRQLSTFPRTLRLVLVELAKFLKDFFFYTRKVPLEVGKSQTSPNFLMFNSQLFFNEIVKHRKVERKGFLERL